MWRKNRGVIMIKKLIVLMVIVLLTGCTNSNHTENNEPETVFLLKEAVSYYADGTKFKETDFEYDEEGRLLYRYETSYGVSKYSNYVSDQGEFTNISEYDEKGRLIREQIGDDSYVYEYENDLLSVMYDSFGKTVYEYNDKGLLIRKEIYYGESSYVSTYEYDGNNNPVKELSDNYNVTRTYDNNGLLLEEHIEYGFDYPKTSIVYEYDKDGRMISYKSVMAFSEDYEDVSLYTWDYDDNGNCINHKEIYNDSDEFLEEFVYEYDEENRPVKETYSCASLPEVSYSMVKEYDENGNLLKWIAYDINDEITGYTEYTYIETNLDKSKMTSTIEKFVNGYALVPDHPHY